MMKVIQSLIKYDSEGDIETRVNLLQDMSTSEYFVGTYEAWANGTNELSFPIPDWDKALSRFLSLAAREAYGIDGEKNSDN